jgi:hypothetical protein
MTSSSVASLAVQASPLSRKVGSALKVWLRRADDRLLREAVKRRNARFSPSPARSLEDPLSGEERGAVRGFGHCEKLDAVIVEHGPAVVSPDD